MSHILEEYSKSLGVKIGKPFIYDNFFPINAEKYITIHNSEKGDSRNYSFWIEVVEILKKYFKDENIKIVQIGTKCKKISNVDINLVDLLNIRQTSYVIKNSILHLGVDSFPVHAASMYNKPIVALYGNMYINQSKPYWGDSSKHILLHGEYESRPCYSFNDPNRTIDTIEPEKIAYSVLNLLNIEHEKNIESISIGEKFDEFMIDIIPDFIINNSSLLNIPINIRLDKKYDLEKTLYILNGRKCIITTDKPIDPKFLKDFKNNIYYLDIIYSEYITEDFIKSAISNGIKVNIKCYDVKDEDANDLKMKLFDFNFEFIKSKNIDELSEELKSKICNKTFFKTNHYILSNNKIYLNYHDFNLGKNAKSFDDNIGKIENSLDFWKSFEYYYIFNK